MTTNSKIEVNLDNEALTIPLKRKKPTTYFVKSMSDLFHESVPDEFIDRVFAVMNATTYKLPIPRDLNAKPWHRYQILTKRPERMCRYIESRRTTHWSRLGSHPIFAAGRNDGGVLRGHGSDVMNAGACLLWPLPNVWLGVSCERQQEADERIPWLLKTPAAVRFLSCEPLLGPINLGCTRAPTDEDYRGWGGDGPIDVVVTKRASGIHWVIVGGESGSGARPMQVEWAESIVAQCKAAGVACFVKQLGSNPEIPDPRVTNMRGDIVGRCSLRLKSKKGGDISEWPESLRVRQMPERSLIEDHQ